MGCRGTAFLTMVFTTSFRGMSAFMPRAPLPLPSLLTLMSTEFFFSCVPIPVFQLQLLLHNISPLKYIITDEFDFGHQWVCLGASWHWLCQIWGKLLATVCSSHPRSSPLAKPCHANPVQAFNYSPEQFFIAGKNYCPCFTSGGTGTGALYESVKVMFRVCVRVLFYNLLSSS